MNNIKNAMVYRIKRENAVNTVKNENDEYSEKTVYHTYGRAKKCTF